MSRCSRLPVHLQSDCAVDDGEAEHSDPAEQNTPERTRLEVHDEDLQAERDAVSHVFHFVVISVIMFSPTPRLDLFLDREGG